MDEIPKVPDVNLEKQKVAEALSGKSTKDVMASMQVLLDKPEITVVWGEVNVQIDSTPTISATIEIDCPKSEFEQTLKQKIQERLNTEVSNKAVNSRTIVTKIIRRLYVAGDDQKDVPAATRASSFGGTKEVPLS